MKTIKKLDEIIRVKDDEAFEKVKSGGFVFCKKSEWKEKVRDKAKVKKDLVKEVKGTKIVKVDAKVGKVDEVVRVKAEGIMEEGTGESRGKNAGLEKYRAKKAKKNK